MNYIKIYNTLVERGQSRLLEGYVERHHIIPRCMGGGNDVSNLVALTPEEHVIAHLLLVKIYPNNALLVYAANMMCNRVHNNKEYGWLKRKQAVVHSKRFSGIPRSEESVAKQRETIRQQFKDGRVGVRTGSVLTKEHKQSISQGNKNKTVPVRSRSSLEGYQLRYGTEEGTKRYERDKIKKVSMTLEAFIKRHGEVDGPRLYNDRCTLLSATKKGKPGTPHTEESKQKIREQKLGKKLYRSPEHNAKIGAANKGKKMPTSTCPHCGLTGNVANISRWHGDNCKYKA